MLRGSCCRTAWFFRRHYDLEARLFTGKKSQHGYPLAFHGEMMREISGHLGRISRIARKHRVPRKWFADYYAAIQKQLLREASVCYPQLRAGFKPISRIRPHSLEVDIQVDLFHAIRAAFAERRISNNARQTISPSRIADSTLRRAITSHSEPKLLEKADLRIERRGVSGQAKQSLDGVDVVRDGSGDHFQRKS